MTGPGAVTVIWGPVSRGERRAAHTTLLRAAADLSGGPADRIRLTYETGGRPRLSGPGAALHVSISHSPGARAVALSTEGPVGVDIETLRPLPALRMARRWLGEADAEWLAGLPQADRVPAFFWLWTQKEAVGKANGRGLAHGGLTRLLPPPAPRPTESPPGAGSPSVLRVLPDGSGAACAVLPTGPGPHVLAVATLGGEDTRIEVRRCDR
ncbi:4'-phosphopantetheinyl transferase family protein [Streptomyces sp. MUM 178J]|uniref:4'-phosphopantetheinyl transferase family protein n=1 Tax=Streptomyces sp. MUM 178J TaxID=2791991 RepID=UPI001F045233|nr:4'-phosphopantetheinyl transferase superfamily protein [Streptomyces sp. MUM 178J]WRQ80777.1 4'-phosphopantetheinyl transferase superfamily protein [Streptomyces sp. MUM 178J]